MSKTSLSAALDKLQLESRQSTVKQHVGMEGSSLKRQESQLSAVISMEATAMVGAATSMRTAVITIIKIVLIRFMRILLLILI